MSQHPSLKIKLGSSDQRSVLKRHEKVKILQGKKLWGETTSIFHLPKVKTIRLKVKKGATAKTEVSAGMPAASSGPAAGTAAPAGKKVPPTTPTTAAKSAAGTKETAKK